MAVAWDLFNGGIYNLDSPQGILYLGLLLVGVAVMLHFAARIVLNRSNAFQAFSAVVLGALAFYFVFYLVHLWPVNLVLGAVCFAAVIALVYKTKAWGKGAAVGALAVVMFQLTGIVLQWLVHLVW